jgi:hypothetical protein
MNYKEERYKRQHKEEMIKAKWSLTFVGIFLVVATVGWIITEII